MADYIFAVLRIGELVVDSAVSLYARLRRSFRDDVDEYEDESVLDETADHEE